jgi:hypothetical protein
MKQPELPPLRMTVENGRMAPADAFTAERLDTYRNGTTMLLQPVVDSQSWKRKKYWAILGRVVKDCATPWDSVKEASNALKSALGVTDDGHTLAGTPVRYPASLNDLQEPEFEEFYEGAMLLLQRITGVDPETLAKESPGSDTPLSEPGEGSGDGAPRSPQPSGAAAAPPRPGQQSPAGEKIQTAQGDATEAESRTGQPPVDSASTPDMRTEAIDKFLALATDKHLTPPERRSALVTVEANWMEELPDKAAFIKACSDTAARVIEGELKAQAAKRYLSALAAKPEENGDEP